MIDARSGLAEKPRPPARVLTAEEFSYYKLIVALG